MLCFMEPSLFTRICRKEIPSYMFYENDYVVGILDRSPLAPGHCLVIPREQVGVLHELSLASAARIGEALVEIGGALVKLGLCRDYNILQNNGPLAGQTVEHVHFHIIPRPDGMRGLQLEWQTGSLTEEGGVAVAAALRNAMARMGSD
jgi:histidine triad (HIT) family protein